MDLGRARLLRPPLIAGALLAANLLLAAGLVASALAPRRLVVLPAARAQAELWPGVVPEASAREFALRYVLAFDNYTPATLEASTDALKRMLAGRRWAAAGEALDRRLRVAVEGRMSSQVLPLRTEVDGLRVTVRALRRTYVSDRLSREAKVAYVVEIEKQPATDANPFGLAVVSQDIREED